MTNCTTNSMNFSPLGRKKVSGSFSGGSITSDGGLLLLREVDKKLQLTNKIAKLITDKRNQSYITHSVIQMLRQRIFGLAAGYEDLNDHDTLRKDIAFQTVVGMEQELAGSSTLFRFENSISRHDCVRLSYLLVEQFIASHKTPPKEITLDFDPTDFTLHGNQENAHYHGYYKNYCYLPLYVFCNHQLLVAYLRPSNIHGSKHGGAILKLLVKILRESWPEVKIVFRCDGAFARRHILSWCENNGIEYLVGLSKNNRIIDLVKPMLESAQQLYDVTKEKQKRYTEFEYQAGSWHTSRRVIAKIEHNRFGHNLRLVVTNKDEAPQQIYEQNYCMRGDMENDIKQQKLDLRADRVSSHEFMVNQFRMLLSGFAYTLFYSLTQTYLKNTKFANAYCKTIRLKLFKIGAIVIKNTRQIKFIFTCYFVDQDLFAQIANHLESG